MCQEDATSISETEMGNIATDHTYAVVRCEIKLFQYYFSLHRRPFEIILFQRAETCLKLFQIYFIGLLQLVDIFRHVQFC